MDACKLGNLMGSIKIASRGPQNHAPSRAEMNAMLKAQFNLQLP
jgi:adenosine kinase